MELFKVESKKKIMTNKKQWNKKQEKVKGINEEKIKKGIL